MANSKTSYDEISEFSEGLALVRVNGQCGYINPHNELVIPIIFIDAWSFSEGLAAVSISIYDTKNNNTCNQNMTIKWGFIDKDGNFVISPMYDLALPFSEGYAGIEICGEWGFVDKKDIAINPQFDAVDSFSAGLAAVKIHDLWGYINKEGSFVIPPQYDEVSRFCSNGLYLRAHVRKDGESYFIDMNGNRE